MTNNNENHQAIEKADFLRSFEELRPDLFFPEAWTNEQKTDAMEQVSPSRTKTNMFASIPMTCRGPKCPHAETCPLLEKGLAPMKKPCPIEMAMVRDFTIGLMNELNVDPESKVEVSMIRDLVDQEVQTLRSSKLLSQEDMIQENVIGLDSDNNPVLKKELHQAVELQDRILKRKKDIRNQLMATREKKAQIGMGHVDSSIALANIFHEVRELEHQAELRLKKKLGILDQDDYILQDKAARETIEDAEIVENGDND